MNSDFNCQTTNPQSRVARVTGIELLVCDSADRGTTVGSLAGPDLLAKAGVSRILGA